MTQTKLNFQVAFDENVNVTPSFHTFDASKIKVGQIPQAAFVGTPVEFDSKFFFHKRGFPTFLRPWNIKKI